jgi:TonB family protein
MNLVRLTAWLVLAAVLPLRGLATDDKKNKETQNEVTELLAHAAALQNIRAPGSPPFHLRLRVHAEHITTKPVDGTYDEVWLIPNKWRREVTFPGFTQAEVGDEDSKWVSRNASFRPSVAFAISRALDVLAQKELLPDEEVSRFNTRKKAGAELHCADLHTSSRNRLLCFGSSGTLVSQEAQEERFEYDDYGKFGHKLFPRHMQVYQSGQRVLDMRVEGLSSAPDAKLELFQHDATAQQMAPCESTGPRVPTKRITPEYPPEARRSFQQGTVILYALLSGDGHVQEVRVVQSVSPALDRAATEAVRQWVYPPVQCGPVPLPTETEISVNFALSVR